MSRKRGGNVRLKGEWTTISKMKKYAQYDRSYDNKSDIIMEPQKGSSCLFEDFGFWVMNRPDGVGVKRFNYSKG